ncbi:MAG: methylmalonyl Co-A mutase-associated GTPase MeaB [Acidobacteria bacterium]|nr:methylmalonyl Co-A mutase-associated GTPase MeaB [Acidobacteriota bacterium]
MSDSFNKQVEQICSGNRRAIAQAISAVESGSPLSVPLLKSLFRKAGRAYVIGITGSPGAGKSTLLEKLAAEYRRQNNRVGIVAVDPTSPFSGGAILGDRIRMQTLATDNGTYIRSMATRGQLGGLAPATRDVAMILDAAGCDVVFVETVGVGQDEVEIARMADATVVIVTPGMGDDIQTFKAGVMEIADLFVINKADQLGVERAEQELQAMLTVAPKRQTWQIPVLKTVATTGEGVSGLREELEKFRNFIQANPLGIERRRVRLRIRLLDLLRQSLFEKVANGQFDSEAIERYVSEILERRRDPHSIVEEMLEASGVKPGRE